MLNTRPADGLSPEHDKLLDDVRFALRKLAPGVPAFTVLLLDVDENAYAIASTSNMDNDMQKEILTACLDALNKRPKPVQH